MRTIGFNSTEVLQFHTSHGHKRAGISQPRRVHRILNAIRGFGFRCIIDGKSYWFNSTNLKGFYHLKISHVHTNRNGGPDKHNTHVAPIKKTVCPSRSTTRTTRRDKWLQVGLRVLGICGQSLADHSGGVGVTLVELE